MVELPKRSRPAARPLRKFVSFGILSLTAWSSPLMSQSNSSAEQHLPPQKGSAARRAPLPELDPPAMPQASRAAAEPSPPPAQAVGPTQQAHEPAAELRKGLTLELDAEPDEPQIRRVPFSARIDESIIERLEAFVAAKPKRGGRGRSKQSVTEKALDAYLRAHGC
jgi:hypothetical protein